jgi:hypothetical protein
MKYRNHPLHEQPTNEERFRLVSKVISEACPGDTLCLILRTTDKVSAVHILELQKKGALKMEVAYVSKLRRVIRDDKWRGDDNSIVITNRMDWDGSRLSPHIQVHLLDDAYFIKREKAWKSTIL